MNQTRSSAASTVFEGKIVVTGGTDNWYKLKSIEAYDYYENKWNSLPDMIERRSYHASVSMGNKLFVIGGESTTSCEIFDSISRKFTLIELKLPKINSYWSSKYQTVCKGNIIFLISENIYLYSGCKDTIMYTYDIQTNQWSEKKCNVLKKLTNLSCVKYCVD